MMEGEFEPAKEAALLDIVADVLAEYREEAMQDSDSFKASVAKLSNFYKPENTSQGVNFSLPEYQCAYLYLYFPWHAHSVRRQLGSEIGDLVRRQGGIRVCSVGGGPGTDFIGLALYLQAQGIDGGEPISGTVLDLYPEWEGMYRTIEQRLDPAIQRHLGDVRFLSFDFKQPFSDEICSEIGQADLVTMVKFISAVSTNIDKCEKQLQLILDEMKKDSILLFIDISGGRCIKRIENAMDIFDFQKMFEVPCVKFHIPESENKSLIQELSKQYGGYSTKTEGGLTIAAWKKRTASQTIKL